jgi:glycosyltransferase involved in cell wall biosynthesis
MKPGVNNGICIVTYPLPMASITPLSNLTAILSKLSSRLYLITGNEGKILLERHPEIKGRSVNYQSSPQFWRRILEHLALQIRIAREVIRLNSKVDVYVFFFGHGLTLPLLACKLMGKPVYLDLAGSLGRISEKERDAYSRIFVLLEQCNYRLADKIVLYSPTLIAEWNLERFSRKIVIAHEHFIDPHFFKILKPFSQRPLSVGYLGRFSEEKGILNFSKAVPEIVKGNSRIKVFLAGDGYLKPRIEKDLRDQQLLESCRLLGWLSREDLPVFFNELRLLVIPSYTEGLPNVILEALACGTPVLATPVGAVPDYIHDNQTGYLLSDNSPQSIWEGVNHALQDPRIEQVAAEGRLLIEREFAFEAALEKFRSILNS